MSRCIALLLFFLFGRHAAADIVPFYVGTYTSPTMSQGIYLDTIDTETGKLGTLKLAVEVKDPNFLAISPDHHFIFAVRDATVESFEVLADGSLKALNEQPTGGSGPCHVSLDQKGKHVFVANYDGGNIASFPVGIDGLIGPRSAFVQFTGTGPDPRRQTKPYAHSIYVDPANRFVYACDLGTDNVWSFRFDAATGALQPNEQAKAKVPPGSGPRHLAFHPGGKFVYVVGEMGLGVTLFARDAANGTLTALETVPTLAPGTSTKNVTAAEICCHPSGKWLYVSDRGADTLAVFAIAPDGRLSLIQDASSVVKFPRSFGIDPTGHWLVVAGQQDNRIAVLKIDPATGRLSATDQSAPVGSPVCVLFEPIK